MARKSKKDPKIIRVGDRVRIHRPFKFIRSGYPLTIPKVAEDLEKEFAEEIDTLVKLALQGRPDTRGKRPIRLSDLPLICEGNPLAETRWEVAVGLAKGVIKARGYGGCKREIYEEEDKRLLGMHAEVDGIRFVQTGTRHSGGWSGWETEEYEPPYFEVDKVHKILYLRDGLSGVEILADNCQKCEMLDDLNDGGGYEEFRLVFVDREKDQWRYLCQSCRQDFIVDPEKGTGVHEGTGGSGELLPECPHCGTLAYHGLQRKTLVPA